MRKGIRQASRRKWIVGGALAFGGVALLTTGFATWIIGTVNNQTDETPNVSIDTVVNQTLLLETTLKEGELYLGEPTTTGDYPISVTNGQETDFSITIDFKITKSKTVAKPTKIVIAINTAYTNDAQTVITNFSSSTVTSIEHPGTSYVELNQVEIAIDENLNWTEENGSDVYTVTDYEINLLKWGSFFGGKEPTEFYKDQLTALASEDGVNGTSYSNPDSGDTIQFKNDAYTELKAFETKFDTAEGKTNSVIPLLLTVE